MRCNFRAEDLEIASNQRVVYLHIQNYKLDHQPLTYKSKHINAVLQEGLLWTPAQEVNIIADDGNLHLIRSI